MIRLGDFEGAWTVGRTIRDLGGGPHGRFAGRARFAPAPGGLLCEEAGILRLGGGPGLTAERRTLWREPEPGRIEVAFEDGRPFHGFAAAGRAEAMHDCPPDTYRVRYDFTGWPRWTAAWRVTGPRKDYLSVTRYLPCEGAGGRAETTPDEGHQTETAP